MTSIPQEIENRINTVYIISKGRPECLTAQTFLRINYPGQWFIVCGNNDETLPEYKNRWGDKVIVFDWYEQIKHTDTLDNFGFEKMPSGAAPVRNATRAIAESRGEFRHWQFDDDYKRFRAYNKETGKNEDIKDGKTLYDCMLKIAYFGYVTNTYNVGFTFVTIDSKPANRKKVGVRIFNAHNMSTDINNFTTWRGRLNDDLVNAIETYQKGTIEFCFKFVALDTETTQKQEGGLTEFYKEVGTARKTAYAIMMAPNAVKLVKMFGRYHHRVNWKRICPKLISEKFKKENLK